MGTFTNSGGTFATDSTLGAVAWTTSSNAQVSDNTYATSVLLITQISNYLKATNFSFAIPLDATISGVTVSIERKSDTLTGTVDSSVRLVKGGVISGNDKASGSTWPTSDASAAYGSSSDLWGLTLTPADVNGSDFGIVINASASLASTASIDYISITVDYLGSNSVPNLIKPIKAGGMPAGYASN